MTGQNAAFGNANTGLNTQYQGAVTGQTAGFNNANAGIGNIYQGNIAGQGNIYNNANTGLGQMLNTGLTNQSNIFNAANTGLGVQYQNSLNPAQYAEYLQAQQQGIGDQYLAQVGSGNAQAAYNTGSTLANQQAGYANMFAKTASSPMTGGTVNAPFAQNSQLAAINNPTTGLLTGAANAVSNGKFDNAANKFFNWWGS